MTSRVLLGTHVHPAAGAAAERQERALESWRRLSGCELVNLQFVRDWTPIEREGFCSSVAMKHDSLTATGASGIRKPLLSEMLSILAAAAIRRQCDYFCFANSDIHLTQAAVEEIRSGAREGYAFSRMEVDPTTFADVEINLGGVDAIAMQPQWWQANAFRFRPFIVGEALWDQMYASILLRHANACLFNVRPLIRHVMHPVVWSERGAFASYNGYLGALDSHYYSLWCEYHAEREAWAARGGPEAENIELQRSAFTRPWRMATRVVQPLRKAKAWGRYSWYWMKQRRRRGAEKPDA